MSSKIRSGKTWSAWSGLVLTLTCCTTVLAQQFSGNAIPNKQPNVPGAELAYFKINNPNGTKTPLTLINYSSLQSNGQRLDPNSVQRAVITIHGLNQDPGTYVSSMMSALSQVTGDSNINFSTVQIMAPYFVNGNAKGTDFPFDTTAGGSTSSALVWKGSQWSAGADSQYPSNSSVSSFEVLDQIIQYYDNTTMFPNMKQIVISGHSLGGQAVQRYAMIGNVLNTNSKVSYWIGNPNTFIWPDTLRPIANLVQSCPTYDNYRDGYANFQQYPMTYGQELVNSGRSAILARYMSRSKNYARGILDWGDDSSSCAPFTTGAQRDERFFNFISAFPPKCQSNTNGPCDTIDYVNAGHDAPTMFADVSGRARLFVDNFYGHNKRAYDFGHPRIQQGDDPFPDPAYSSLVPIDTRVYPGGMTYQGCWTDDSTTGAQLAVLAYDQTTNTIDTCTQTCANMGYLAAGMEYGSQCRCGNSIGPYSSQTANRGCLTPCPGNSSQVCGAGYRLNMFSVGPLAKMQIPVAPQQIANYQYYGCMTEGTTGRTLNDASTSGDGMTLESCAAYCNGYTYFGMEYSSQCFCGNRFLFPSTMASAGSCGMMCAGNQTQLCGGPNLLSVYTNVQPDTSNSSLISISPTTLLSTTTTTTDSTTTTPTTTTTTTSSSTTSTITTDPVIISNIATSTPLDVVVSPVLTSLVSSPSKFSFSNLLN